MNIDPEVHKVTVKRVPGSNTPVQSARQYSAAEWFRAYQQQGVNPNDYQANISAMWDNVLNRKA